jgi:hypothetical protein
MAGNRDKFTPAERAAWAAQQDRIRAAGGVKAYRDKLSREIDKSLKANAPAPKAGHNSKRPRALVIDTSGSSAFDDIRWKGGEVFYTFTNGYGYSDAMDKATFRDWQAANSLGEWWNRNWK